MIFAEMRCQSQVDRLLAFTKQLTSHVHQGRHNDVLTLFRHIQTTLSLPLDAHVITLALKSSSVLRRPRLGAALHAHVTKSSLLPNPHVASSLLNLYGKCFSLRDARDLFDEIPNRNVFIWNTMISACTRHADVTEAFRVFEAMDVEPDAGSYNSVMAGLAAMRDGSCRAVEMYRRMRERGLRPDLMTMLALIRAGVGAVAVKFVREIHGYDVRNGTDSRSQLGSALVEAYGRCGCIENARKVFKGLEEKDVVAWSSLISVYASHGEARAALDVFREMEMAEVVPDEITFLAVLKACSHAEGLADEAVGYFDCMHRYNLCANSDHYSCLVDVLSRAGRLCEAYEVIRKMPVKVTVRAWGALLSGCRTYGNLELAEIVAKALSELEPNNPSHYLLLSEMYARLGRHDEAQRMRREMKQKGVQAVGSSWVVQE